MVSIMTSLWFRHLRADDRVSVKPHASPVLHAINYLLGELDESYLPTLRAFGGLQSYPSRVKDPDPVDYSTGSVGIGATAPIWGAVARRYLSDRFTGDGTGAPGRQYSLLGDAELDEGAVWEAIVDPGVAELGEIVWVVDVNRQSLDRVVPADRRRPAAGHVQRGGLAGHHAEVRAAARGAVRPAGRGGAAAPDRRHAQPRVPAAAALPPGRAARAAARRRTRPLARLVADLDDTDAGQRHPQPRRPRPGRAGRGLRGHRRHPAHGHPRLHDQGLRPGRRGAPAEPLGAADRGAAGASWRRSSAPIPASRGTGPRRTARRASCARRPPGGCAARPRPAQAPPARARRPRPHPDRGGHHPGRAGPGPARPDPGGARGGRGGS